MWGSGCLDLSAGKALLADALSLSMPDEEAKMSSFTTFQVNYLHHIMPIRTQPIVNLKPSKW